MNNPIKVAVIGAGMMGKNHLRTYKNLNGFELVGVYDIFPEAAQKAAEMFGIKAFASLEEVAAAVDAVSVVTTSVTHAEVGEFFLNKGIKPTPFSLNNLRPPSRSPAPLLCWIFETRHARR